MSIEYTWHSVGSESCYNCNRHDGKVFKRLEDVPELPVHPNCKCYIVASGENEVEIESVANDLKGAIIDTKEQLDSINQNPHLKRELNNVESGFKQVLKTLEIFWNNYQDMREANTLGADKYFHSKANAQAVQLGETAEKTAEFISNTREALDVYKNLLVRKFSFEETMKDGQSDLKANQHGRDIGRKYPKGDVRHHLGLYRPDYLDEKY